MYNNNYIEKKIYGSDYNLQPQNIFTLTLLTKTAVTSGHITARPNTTLRTNTQNN